MATTVPGPIAISVMSRLPPFDAPIIRAPVRARARLRTAAAGTALWLALLAGCSNSELVVGALYDRADDRARSGIEDWVTLDAEQRAAFDAYVGTFHTWHRRSELPRYAALIGEMSETLGEHGTAGREEWTRWLQEIDARVQALKECHPARFATATIATLDADQVDRIEAHRAERAAERDAERGDRTRAERIARRVANVDKWVGRLGVELEERQLGMIRDAFERQTSLNAEFRALSDAWYATLFELLRDTDAPDFAPRLDAHVAAWFTMLEDAHPETWQRNRALWRDFAVEFERSLSGLQRRDATRWMAKMASTLEAVSRDEPDWLPADDPAFDCVAGDPAGGAGSG